MGTLLYLFKQDLDPASKVLFNCALDELSLAKKKTTQEFWKYRVKAWVDKYGYLEKVTSRQVLEFIEYQRAKNLSNKTIKRTIHCVSLIYKKLKHEDVFSDALKLIKTNNHKPEKRKCEMLDFNKVKSFIDSFDERKLIEHRNKAIVSLLIGGAMRRCEVLNLRIKDISYLDDGMMIADIHDTKVNQRQRQAISFEFSDVVKSFIDRRLEDCDRDDFIFCSYTKSLKAKGQYDKNECNKMIKRYAKKNNIKDIASHSFRRTAISRLLELQIDRRYIREFSRHADIRMLEVYDKRRVELKDSVARVLKF